jgi:hypothetical protein
VVENEDTVRAIVMIVSPATEDIRRKRGQACRTKNTKGAPRYMVPEAEVPITAIPEVFEENRGRLL